MFCDIVGGIIKLLHYETTSTSLIINDFIL